MIRPAWDEYFMGMLDRIASRSTCLRRKVGAILTKDNRIIATGYNGQPPEIAHCIDLGVCRRKELNTPSGQRHEICRAIHAEENALLQASYFGISAKGSTLYVKCTPCSYCTKSILSAGISRVVYEEDYPDDLAKELREESGIEFERYYPQYSVDSEIKFNFPAIMTNISKRKQLEKIQEEFMEFLTAKNDLEKYREWIDYVHCCETYMRTQMDIHKLEEARKFVIDKNSGRGYYIKK